MILPEKYKAYNAEDRMKKATQRGGLFFNRKTQGGTVTIRGPNKKG